MFPTIKLKKHLHSADGKTASVLMIISIDQIYQQKEDFEAFCLKMNEEYKEGHCHKVTIIETGYLKRHYLALDSKFSSSEESDLAAIQLGIEWREEQKESINKLKMPVKIISWKEILETQLNEKDKPFCEYLSDIKKTYETDKCFKGHVEHLSKKYAKKLLEKYDPEKNRKLDDKCLEAARNYLLEESSIIFKLVHYDFTHQLYPGAGNAALRYVHRKYFGENNPLPWVEYKIENPNDLSKLKSSNSCFFKEVGIDNQNTNIKKNILLELNKLKQEEQIKLINELYIEYSMKYSSFVSHK
ncbi:hypothetical protein [Rickettsiella massiliensis]|uniref:hypothetical protein n=1 Tax=Rickettsiella massiliensis TaxID=676517 RepID=UPI00029A0414|nr:hypothetical protein [Rickettsiella massiliensis]